jgi:hypothetical protein
MAQLKKNPELERLHVIYFRPTNSACAALDEKLRGLADRYRGRLQLVVKSASEPGYAFGGWISGRSPTTLFVRDGKLVAQMIGDLPAREIDNLALSALTATPTMRQ